MQLNVMPENSITLGQIFVTFAVDKCACYNANHTKQNVFLYSCRRIKRFSIEYLAKTMLRHRKRCAHLPEKTGLRNPQLEKRAAPTPKTPPSIGFHMGDRNVNSRLPLLVNNSNGSNFDGSPMLTISSCKDNVTAQTKYKNTTYSPASSCFSKLLSIAMRH